MTISEALVGQVVTAWGVSEDRESLVFQLAGGGTVVLQTESGCCSKTWIEHVDGVEAFEGAVITEVEAIDMPEPPQYVTVAKRLGVEEEDAELYYGLRITTTKGRVVVDYRNNNSYYGGTLEVVEPQEEGER